MQKHIFTFSKHFDKENDCVYETVITEPHHWRSNIIFMQIAFVHVHFRYFDNKRHNAF